MQEKFCYNIVLTCDEIVDTRKVLIGYCDQLSSDNIYIKLSTYKT